MGARGPGSVPPSARNTARRHAGPQMALRVELDVAVDEGARERCRGTQREQPAQERAGRGPDAPTLLARTDGADARPTETTAAVTPSTSRPATVSAIAWPVRSRTGRRTRPPRSRRAPRSRMTRTIMRWPAAVRRSPRGRVVELGRLPASLPPAPAAVGARRRPRPPVPWQVVHGDLPGQAGPAHPGSDRAPGVTEPLVEHLGRLLQGVPVPPAVEHPDPEPGAQERPARAAPATSSAARSGSSKSRVTSSRP